MKTMTVARRQPMYGADTEVMAADRNGRSVQELPRTRLSSRGWRMARWMNRTTTP